MRPTQLRERDHERDVCVLGRVAGALGAEELGQVTERVWMCRVVIRRGGARRVSELSTSSTAGLIIEIASPFACLRRARRHPS